MYHFGISNKDPNLQLIPTTAGDQYVNIRRSCNILASYTNMFMTSNATTSLGRVQLQDCFELFADSDVQEQHDGFLECCPFGELCQHRQHPCCSHILFSSTGALLGVSRSSDYAASNAYLEGLVLLRAAFACAGTHTAWGAVAQVGLAA